MAGNTFGRQFRITTAGESHGPGNTVIIDGCPPGLPLSEADLQPDLDRRRPGQSKITTQRNEADNAKILAGVFQGKTTGTAIAVFIENADHRSRDYSDICDKYRPGHADYTYQEKYGIRDYRGGGRASARETVARVAAGAVARKLLGTMGIGVLGWVRQVGGLIAEIDDVLAVNRAMVEANQVRCPDPGTAEKMIELIHQMRKQRDSVGGVAEVVATGIPTGLGDPVFDKLKATLAHGLMSIPAVVGFEYGTGFRAAAMKGSQHNDLFVCQEGRTTTASNRHGGMLGGISSGLPLIVSRSRKTHQFHRPTPTNG